MRSAFPSSGCRSFPFPGFGGSHSASATRASSASARGCGRHRSTSTPGGTTCTRPTVPQTSATTSRMCSEPAIVAAAPASASRPQRESCSLPRIEYSSSEPWAFTT